VKTLPKRPSPCTVKLEPTEAKLRIDSALPRCSMSRTAIALPNLAAEKTDSVDPARAKLRSDSVLPSSERASTEMDAPNRAAPKALITLPSIT
jgi:hypothetical protein